MTHLYNLKKRTHSRSLRELCTEVLIDNKHALGDVGDVPSAHLIPVLSHCTPEELQKIEDKTLARSGRDIRWDTWRIWKRIYVSKYGKPNPDEVPELRAISDDAMDPDNLPEDLGDYRTLYEHQERNKEAQRMKLAEKLRKMKRKDQLSKEKMKAKKVDAVMIGRSRPRMAGSQSRMPVRGLKKNSGMSHQDFYQKLGLSKTSKTLFKKR